MAYWKRRINIKKDSNLYPLIISNNLKESGTGKTWVTVASIAMLDEHNSLEYLTIISLERVGYEMIESQRGA